MAKNNFYGVKEGREIGVYPSWDEAKKHIEGYSGAKYKGFKTEEEAHAFVYGDSVESPKQETSIESNPGATVNAVTQNADLYYVYVDGSFMENINRVGYGVVFSKDDETPLFCDCGRVMVNDTTSRQVIGEVQAVVRTIQMCKANNIKNICICYDYEGIPSWIKGEWKADKPISKRYVEYFKEHIGDIKYSFRHVSAHTGITLNEMADGLAKKGCML